MSVSAVVSSVTVIVALVVVKSSELSTSFSVAALGVSVGSGCGTLFGGLEGGEGLIFCESGDLADGVLLLFLLQFFLNLEISEVNFEL